MMCRYQYDPNGRVRDAMSHIWAALVPEPKVALDAHFGSIADDLIKEMGGRMWRSREAASLALADLLQVTSYLLLALRRVVLSDGFDHSTEYKVYLLCWDYSLNS